MTRYADPEKCPDCAAPIAYGAAACGSCGLPLSGSVAQELFRALSHADTLLASLRASASTAPLASSPSVSHAPQGPTAQATGSAPTGSVAAPPDHPAGPAAPVEPRPAMQGSSVPKILLTLGAGCLLVAALVFLAYTWALLGVGGRTAVLVLLTGASGWVTSVVAKRELRGAVEAMGLVTLGLLGLDLAGADNAGWFGDISASTFLVVLGAGLVAGSLTACHLLRRTPTGEFTGGEVVAALGAGLASLGLATGSSGETGLRLLGATVVALGIVLLAHRLGFLVTAVGAGAVAIMSWLSLALHGLSSASDPATLAHVWGDLAAWPLIAAAAIAAGLAAVGRLPLEVRQGAASVALLVAAVPVVLPALDEGVTEASLALSAVLVGASLLLWLTSKPWSATALLTVCALTAFAALELVGLLAVGGGRLLESSTEHGLFLDRLPAVGQQDVEPWLVIVNVATLLLAAVAILSFAGRRLPHAVLLPAGVLAALGTAALYAVPVWVFVATGIATGLVTLVRRQPAYAAAWLMFALVVALHSDGLTAVALGAVLLAAGWVLSTESRSGVRDLVGSIAVVTLAWSVWTWGLLLDLPGEWMAAVGIVVVALAGAAVRNLGAEVGTAVGMLALFMAGGISAPGSELSSWLAIYLTLAGASISGYALWRSDRRELGWVGGLLLAAATWVRLADIGVEEPEPYTLPSAIALLVVGLLHLRRQPGASTFRALSAGLCLALVPSLLWVLDDPATLRSALLGVACVGILVLGVTLRWAAPIVYAGSTLALVVLRHAGPYLDNDVVPRWVLIGLAGALLITMGVTWEQRVREARQVLGYVRGLR